MNRFKLLVTAVCILGMNVLFAQNKTTNTNQNQPLIATHAAGIDFSVEQNQHYTHFVVAHNLNYSNAVIKRFSVHSTSKHTVSIVNQSGKTVGTFSVEVGDNDVQFLCYRDVYTLQHSLVDISDPTFTN